MKKYIKRWLDIESIEGRLNQVEAEIGILRETVDQNLNDFGDYKNRTEEELKVMGGVVDNLMDSLEAIMKKVNTIAVEQRANRLFKRLRNHQTRIKNSRLSIIQKAKDL